MAFVNLAAPYRRHQARRSQNPSRTEPALWRHSGTLAQGSASGFFVENLGVPRPTRAPMGGWSTLSVVQLIAGVSSGFAGIALFGFGIGVLRSGGSVPRDLLGVVSLAASVLVCMTSLWYLRWRFPKVGS